MSESWRWERVGEGSGSRIGVRRFRQRVLNSSGPGFTKGTSCTKGSIGLKEAVFETLCFGSNCYEEEESAFLAFGRDV